MWSLSSACHGSRKQASGTCASHSLSRQLEISAPLSLFKTLFPSPRTTEGRRELTTDSVRPLWKKATGEGWGTGPGTTLGPGRAAGPALAVRSPLLALELALVGAWDSSYLM